MLEILKKLNTKENLVLTLEQLEYIKLIIKFDLNYEKDVKTLLEDFI